MTFNEAVTHLTRNGDTLLEAMELVARELDETPEGEEPEFLSPFTFMAYQIVRREMRKLFV